MGLYRYQIGPGLRFSVARRLTCDCFAAGADVIDDEYSFPGHGRRLFPGAHGDGLDLQAGAQR